jgi:hypothetical protein
MNVSFRWEKESFSLRREGKSFTAKLNFHRNLICKHIFRLLTLPPEQLLPKVAKLLNPVMG